MAVFKRSWRLTIELENKIKTFQELENADMSLKIDFSAKNSVKGYCEGNITLCNLSRNDMLYLANCATFGKNGITKQNKITLECGYNGDLAIILAGNIQSVNADFGSVDNKIQLKIIGNLSQNTINKGKAISINGNVDLKQVCKELTTLQKIKLQYDESVKPTLLKGFTFLGTPLKLLENLRESFKDYVFYFSEDGQTLKVEMQGATQKRGVQKLSYKTGLIGTPTPTQFGITATSLLNTALKVGGWVKLESQKVSGYNGDWYITEISHKGTNQGADWLSMLELRKEAVVL